MEYSGVYIAEEVPGDYCCYANGLTGVMDWTFVEDTFDNSHIPTIRKGVNALTATSAI